MLLYEHLAKLKMLLAVLVCTCLKKKNCQIQFLILYEHTVWARFIWVRLKEARGGTSRLQKQSANSRLFFFFFWLQSTERVAESCSARWNLMSHSIGRRTNVNKTTRLDRFCSDEAVVLAVRTRLWSVTSVASGLGAAAGPVRCPERHTGAPRCLKP